jgi:hypothetical protein
MFDSMRSMFWDDDYLEVCEEHCKHVLEMMHDDLFENFQKTIPKANIVINTIEKLKPWYIQPNRVCDSCLCYHVELQC